MSCRTRPCSGRQPANVHVEQWLPLAALLPRCAAVLCHGGAGTTLAALACGLPLVLAPQGADQFEMAAACLRAGVARVLPPGHPADAVPAAVAALLAEGPERAAGAGRGRRSRRCQRRGPWPPGWFAPTAGPGS